MAKGKIEKIAVNKNDEPTAIAEKLIDSEADEIILSIPKFSKFAESISNFKLIKRESDILEKTVTVETVDEDALALAEESGLEARNPFFGRMERKQFSDIRFNSKNKKPSSAKTEKAPEPKKKEKIEKAEVPATPVSINRTPIEKKEEIFKEPFLPRHEIEREQDKKEELHTPLPIVTHYSSTPNQEGILNKIKKYKPVRKKKAFFKRTGILVVLILIIFGLVPYLAFAVLPKAEINIITEKKPWSFEGPVAALTTLTEINTEDSRIPGQIFSQENNLTLTFPANGLEEIESKATGQIIIYNAFSSEPQPLVATTRFETPDGKIFRIVEDVNVPGAKIEDGKVLASSISVSIVADKAGEAYNLEKVERLSIPGFSGSAKFDSFYGEIKTPTSGGFIGEAKVATEEDAEQALEQATVKILEGSKTLSRSKIPEDFTLLKEASLFEIGEQDLNRQADANGEFSVYTEGVIRQFAFKEEQLVEMLRQKALTELEEEFSFDNYTIEYTGVNVDFENKLLTLTIEFKADLEKAIDAEALEGKIRGKKESELDSIISAINGVEKAEISLWPFWVRTVPENPSKVEVLVD